MLTRRSPLLVSLAALPFALAGQQPAPANWRAAATEMDRYAQADSTVGAALVFVRDGRITNEHYIGWADRAARVPADRGTIWHWGSITKTLTAVGAMQLVERGRLDLAAPGTRWVPELRRIHNPFGAMDDVTVRMLMSHSSGLPSGTWPWSRGESWEPFEPTEWSQLVAMMPYMKLAFAPGARYNYSNPAIVYVARIIEQITGDPWQGYIFKNLFAPLSLHESSFGATPWHLADRRSHNYHLEKSDNGIAVRDGGTDFDPGATIPNGGWNAPISDIAIWASFLTGSSDRDTQARYDRLLPRRTLESMWQPIVRVNAEEEMGLSFFVRAQGAQRLIGHTGTQGGFRSFMWLDPAARTAVIGVVNTSNDVDGRTSSTGFNALMAAARRVLVLTP